jgi:hypothetical protein
MVRRLGALRMASAIVVGLALASIGSAALAQSNATPVADATGSSASEDPLQSADCQRALRALDADEKASAPTSPGAAAGAHPAAPDPRLAASRRRAAQACLATRTDPPRAPQPMRLAQPPIAIAPVGAGRAPIQPGLPSQPLVPATRPAERPSFVVSCDPGGCWANDGSRLNRVGPNLSGSRGICALQGVQLQCP